MGLWGEEASRVPARGSDQPVRSACPHPPSIQVLHEPLELTGELRFNKADSGFTKVVQSVRGDRQVDAAVAGEV